MRPLTQNQLGAGVQIKEYKPEDSKKSPYIIKNDKKRNFSFLKSSEAYIQKIKLQDLINLKAAKQKLSF
jgi:hypothetical protein